MQTIDFFNLETRESPKEILEADFPSLGKLPISGGWAVRTPQMISDLEDEGGEFVLVRCHRR